MRELVGSRYTDLLHSADKIIEMSARAEGVLDASLALRKVRNAAQGAANGAVLGTFAAPLAAVPHPVPRTAPQECEALLRSPRGDRAPAVATEPVHSDVLLATLAVRGPTTVSRALAASRIDDALRAWLAARLAAQALSSGPSLLTSAMLCDSEDALRTRAGLLARAAARAAANPFTGLADRTHAFAALAVLSGQRAGAVVAASRDLWLEAASQWVQAALAALSGPALSGPDCARVLASIVRLVASTACHCAAIFIREPSAGERGRMEREGAEATGGDDGSDLEDEVESGAFFGEQHTAPRLPGVVAELARALGVGTQGPGVAPLIEDSPWAVAAHAGDDTAGRDPLAPYRPLRTADTAPDATGVLAAAAAAADEATAEAATAAVPAIAARLAEGRGGGDDSLSPARAAAATCTWVRRVTGLCQDAGAAVVDAARDAHALAHIRERLAAAEAAVAFRWRWARARCAEAVAAEGEGPTPFPALPREVWAPLFARALATRAEALAQASFDALARVVVGMMQAAAGLFDESAAAAAGDEAPSIRAWASRVSALADATRDIRDVADGRLAALARDVALLRAGRGERKGASAVGSPAMLAVRVATFLARVADAARSAVEAGRREAEAAQGPAPGKAVGANGVAPAPVSDDGDPVSLLSQALAADPVCAARSTALAPRSSSRRRWRRARRRALTVARVADLLAFSCPACARMAAEAEPARPARAWSRAVAPLVLVGADAARLWGATAAAEAESALAAQLASLPWPAASADWQLLQGDWEQVPTEASGGSGGGGGEGEGSPRLLLPTAPTAACAEAVSALADVVEGDLAHVGPSLPAEHAMRAHALRRFAALAAARYGDRAGPGGGASESACLHALLDAAVLAQATAGPAAGSGGGASWSRLRSALAEGVDPVTWSLAQRPLRVLATTAASGLASAGAVLWPDRAVAVAAGDEGDGDGGASQEALARAVEVNMATTGSQSMLDGGVLQRAAMRLHGVEEVEEAGAAAVDGSMHDPALNAFFSGLGGAPLKALAREIQGERRGADNVMQPLPTSTPRFSLLAVPVAWRQKPRRAREAHTPGDGRRGGASARKARDGDGRGADGAESGQGGLSSFVGQAVGGGWLSSALSSWGGERASP